MQLLSTSPLVIGVVGGGDVFPTRYRANSPADIRRLATGAGRDVVKIELIEGRTEYLRFSPRPFSWAGFMSGWSTRCPACGGCGCC